MTMTNIQKDDLVEIEIDLDDDLLAVAEAHAKKEGLTLNDFLVKILTDYIATEKTDNFQ